MTTGELANLCGSSVALAGSLAFIAVYTTTARGWWRSAVGRLLVIKAVALSVFMALTVGVYLLGAELAVVRWIRGGFAAAFGLAMFVQASFVVRAQRTGGDHPAGRGRRRR